MLIILVLAPATRLSAAEPADDNPFGAAPAEGAKEPAAPAKPAAAKPASAEPQEKDPIVLTVRSTNPKSADQLVWAARTVLDVNRADEARKYLKQLLDHMPAPATLAALEKEFGAGLFVRFSGDEKLQPEGKQISEAVLTAAEQARNDPARLDALIARLSDANPETRRMALTDLKETREPAAAAMIRALADPQRAAQHAAVRGALAAMGSLAEGPLLAALDTSLPGVKSQVISSLGLMKSRAAIGHLMRPLADRESPAPVRQAAEEAFRQITGAVPNSGEVERYLTQEVRRGLTDMLAAKDDGQSVKLWTWDEKQRTVVAAAVSKPAALRKATLRFAQDLHALFPESSESRRLWLTVLLEWAKSESGLTAVPPLAQKDAKSQATAEGAGPLEETLAFAMETGHDAAAIGALEILKGIGNDRLLAGGGGEPRTVVRALRNPNPRVQFAAAEAITAWDPTKAFPGSSRLVETLAFFLKTAGTRRTLVGNPRPDLAQDLAGMLKDMGFDADTANTGESLVKRAIATPDLELILISDAIDGPPVKDLVQQLRHDARTARLPIGILARGTKLEDLNRFAADDALTLAFPRVQDKNGLVLHVRRLLELNGGNGITPEERIQWAEAALKYFARVAGDPNHYLFPEVLAQQPAIIRAMWFAPLSAPASQVLGTLGSPEAQRALVSLASQNDQALPPRRAAAAAFAIAVNRRGILLSRGEILAQYDRYNQSATLDKDTQKVLGSLLDAIEAPSRTKQ
jgi:hypothetical protein